MKLFRPFRSLPVLRSALALALAAAGALAVQGSADATVAVRASDAIGAAPLTAPAVWSQAQGAGTSGSALSSQDLAGLRRDLARVNAEIDALKKGDRNVRDDARLRARLADAEALARRLTQAERTAGTAGTATTGSAIAGTATAEIAGTETAGPGLGRPVEASPQDAPSDLEAKADILADRARRVGLAAAQLDGRLRAFRTRQELKRAAGQLDQDPFAAFESSKRRVVASGGTSFTGASHEADRPKAASPALDQPVPVSGTGTTDLGTKGGAGTAPQRGVTDPAVGPTAQPPSWGGLETSATLALQFRDSLDPVTLADIRRLEGGGSANGRALAMQRALAALKAQQDALNAQARLLRARAQAK